MNDYEFYDILGVDKNASATEIHSAYMNKRAELSSKMFTSGQEGEEAARKLDALDKAYARCMDELNRRSSGAGKAFGTDAAKSDASDAGGDKVNPDEFSFERDEKTDNEGYYRKIEEQIKADNLTEAQKLLDDMDERTAEWHYLQSIVYYKKNWYLESKKQLGFALNMEPNNPKYKSSVEKLTKIMSSKTINPEKFTSRDESHYSSSADYGAGNGTCTGHWCGDVCLANMCCNCASGMCCR